MRSILVYFATTVYLNRHSAVCTVCAECM